MVKLEYFLSYFLFIISLSRLHGFICITSGRTNFFHDRGETTASFPLPYKVLDQFQTYVTYINIDVNLHFESFHAVHHHASDHVEEVPHYHQPRN